MLRKKVLGIGTNSATLLVQDTEANNALRVLRRINVAELSDDEVKGTLQFYEKILAATSRMPALVEVHTVLLQNSFLNIITSYGAGGDLATFFDDELSEALPEKAALQWLLVVAYAVKQLREATRLPFYGLSLERVYFTGRVSGEISSLPETVVVGLPVPPSVYQKGLTDRIAQGVAVEREYPPEVVAKKSSSGYDPNLSDVWVLGSLGARLLSANAQLSSRSSRTRELLAHMTADKLAERYSVDQVIHALTAMVGAPSLPIRERTTTNTTAKNKGTPSVTSDAPALPRAAPRHRHTPQQRTPTPTQDASAGKTAGWQQKAQEQFDVLKRMNSGTQGSPLRRTNSRGTVETSPARQQVSSKPAKGSGGTGTSGSRPTSRTGSARRLRRSGSSNSALRSSNENKAGLRAVSPVVSNSSANVNGGDGPASRSGTPNNAKIRDLLAEQQENLRLRRERLRQEREQQRKQGGGGGGDASDRTGTPEPEVESEEAEPQGAVRRQIHEWRKKKADEAAASAAADGAKDGVLVFTPPTSSIERDTHAAEEAATTAAKAQKGRKNASPAVRRPPGSPRGSGSAGGGGQDASPRMSTPDARSFANLKGNQAPIHYTRQKEIPITVAVPKGFEEDGSADGTGRGLRGEVASPPGARRRPASRGGRQEWVGTAAPAAAATTPGSSANHTPSDASPKRDAPLPAARTGGVTPPRDLSTRGAGPHPTRPHVPQTRGPHTDPTPPTSADQSMEGAPAEGPPRGASGERATQMSLQCAIDALRSSIRNLCRNRNLYGEAMVITSEFARQTEPIRTAPRANEEFMRRLKEGLADNRLFAAAAPLCAQLVALEGLEQSIFEAQRAQPRPAR